MTGRFYSTANWQAIRARQLAKHPLCQACADITPANEVDHIVPIRAGGAKRDPANLSSLCRPCHAGKTAAEREGKTWTPPKHRGCFPDGSPRDPAHPWFTGGKGGSATGGCATRPAGSSKTELVFEDGSKLDDDPWD